MDQQNALLRAIQSGLVDPAQLDDQQLAQLLPTPQPRFDVPAMQQNTMRVENGPDAGQVTNLNFSGQPGTPQAPSPDQPSGSMADLMAKFAAAKQQPSQQMPNLDLSGQGGPKIMAPGGNAGTMRVVGSGNGAVVDLGTEPAQPPSLDYARGKIDIPGVGRGYYGKDGNAYVQNPDGSITKALLGYDMQGSMELNKNAQEMQKGAADIAHTQEQIRASKVSNPDWMGEQGGYGAPQGQGGADLSSVPSGVLAQAQAVARGDAPLPSTRSGKMSPIAVLAFQINPALKATDYVEKQATVQDFSPKGKSGQAVQGINQAIIHAAEATDAVNTLGNYNGIGTSVNPIKNWFEQKGLGDTRQSQLQLAFNALGEELKKAYGGGTVAELENWQKGLDPNASQQQQLASISEAMRLLEGAVQSRQQAYQRGTGSPLDFGKLLDPNAKAALLRLEGGKHAAGFGIAGTGNAPAGGARSFSSEAEAAAAGLAPGTRVVIGGVSGTWH